MGMHVGMSSVAIALAIAITSLPGQTLRARFTGDERNTRGRAKGDERERERGYADSEQVSVGSAGMLAEPIRLQQSCDSVLIR